MSTNDTKDQEIFEIARHIGSPAARDAYLQQACGEDDARRERINHLLSALADNQSFLESPAAGFLGETVEPVRTTQPGEQIGPYKLLQPIGEGGMGTVWMAEQHEPVRRRVAIKLIKAGMDSRQVLARFEAERQALSMMDHPNIAKVLDAGTTGGGGNGRPYFVMELVKGQPITAYCDEKHLNPRERLELFLPVCHAIQHAHQKGIIHRDIKPSNVLVAEYDGRPVAKVIDFGVAKAVHQPLTEKTMFTGLGQIIGTLEYMSPEQARVNQLDIDTRSDVYSLGVLLYELLTGSTPFDKQRMRDAALDELLRIIREEEPPRPSTKLSSSHTLPSIAANRRTEPARLSVLVRGELDWIVMKSLEKDRNRRYETANGFAMDIQRYLNDEAVLACPPSAAYRFRKFARKNKAFLATTALVSAALVLGLIGTTWQAYRATRAESLALAERDEKEVARREALASSAREAQQRLLAEAAAESEAEQRRIAEAAAALERIAKEAEAQHRAAAEAAEKKAVEEAAIAKAVSDFLKDDLLGLVGAEEQLAAEIEPDPDLKLGTLLDRALVKIESRFADQLHVRVAIQETLASALYSIGRYAEAAELLESVRKYREKTLGLEHIDTLASMHNLARAYLGTGNLQQALQLYAQTLALMKDTHGPEHLSTLTSMSGLAVAYHAAGELDKALPLMKETLELRKANLGPEHPRTLDSMHNLAVVYRTAGELDKALSLFEQTLELRKAILGPEHPNTLDSMNALAATWRLAGEPDKATLLLQQTLEIRMARLGPEHPETLESMNSLAVAYNATGQLDRALPLHEQAFEQLQVRLGPSHPFTLTTMKNLAVAYRKAGQFEKARSLFEETLELMQVELGPSHPKTLICMNDLALVNLQLHNLEQARALIEKALELGKVELGPEHPTVISFMNNLGSYYQAAGQFDQAILLHEQTLALTKAHLGLEHPNTARSINNLAQSYRSADQLDKAVPLHKQALELLTISLGADHPETLGSIDTLAAAYQAADQLEKALPLLEQSLKLKAVRLGPDHPATLTSITSISGVAFTYYQQGNHSKALEVLQPAWEIHRPRSESQPADRKLRASLQIMRSAILNQLGRWEEAEHDAREALGIRRELIPDDWGTFNALSHLGESLLGQKKFTEAAALLLDGYHGLKERESQIPALHKRQYLAEACERLGRLYEAQGNTEEASRWNVIRASYDPPAPDLK